MKGKKSRKHANKKQLGRRLNIIKKINNKDAVFLILSLTLALFFVGIFALINDLNNHKNNPINSSQEHFDNKKLNNYINNLSKKNKDLYDLIKNFDNIEEIIKNFDEINRSVNELLSINSTKDNFFEQINESCNNLSTKKEIILCKAYFKNKKLNLESFKNYLPYALVIFGEISAEEALNKYNVDRTKLAEALKNESICVDEDCKTKVRKYIKYYPNESRKEFEKNVLIAYYLYKKGIFEPDN